MKNIINFHVKNGCYVEIKSLQKINGCFVNFPKNILYNIDPVSKTYIVDEYGWNIELYITKFRRNIASKKIPTLQSNIRLLILQDIILYTFSLGLSKDLIVIENNKKLFDIIKLNVEKEELEKERKLCHNLKQMLLGERAPYNNLEGFSQVLECFENGGL